MGEPDARQQRQIAQATARTIARDVNLMEIARREADYAAARLRAKLSVLDLTEKDKRFLRLLKVAI